VSTKVWVEDSGYEPAKKAFKVALDKLQLEYLDLYLIHRPRGDVQGSWRAMEELNAAGKIRAIGVSNFDRSQIAPFLSATTKPVINQLETHPYFQETDELSSLRGQNSQRGVIAIPRSSNPAHRRENLAIFGFTLDPEDMQQITILNLNRSQFPEWT
jgi:2,5-diketo-D-gluconate reductase A